MANDFFGQVFRKTDAFEIRVKHWTTQKSQFMGGNCWNLYAIIKRQHPLFTELIQIQNYMESDLLCQMPFHGGVTFFEKDESGEEVVIGCDYLHSCDMNGSMKADTLEEAVEVREDADNLFKFFVQSLRKAKIENL